MAPLERVIGLQIEARCTDALTERDSCSHQTAADAVAALRRSDGHLGEFVFAGTHSNEGAAADADAIAHGHEDAATVIEDRGLRMPQHFQVRGLEPEVALDPLAIQFEEGVCIGWLKFSDDDIGHRVDPPACTVYAALSRALIQG